MTSPELYPTQFHRYLTRNLTYVLGLVQGSGPVLSDEVRAQALHTLSYALQAPLAWLLTRELFITLAPKMEQGGQREHWIPYLQAALHQSAVEGDDAAAGECHFQLALLYRLLSHFATAHEHLQAALARFTALDARRDQARVLNELAWLEHLQHRYDAASRHVEQAISLLEPDDSERAMSYRVQGMIAFAHRDWQNAEIYHLQALQIFKRHQDQRRVAWSLQNVAYTLYEQKKYREALPLYIEAVTILQTLEDNYHLGIVYFNLALTYQAHGELSETIVYYQQAEKIFQALNAKLQLAKLNTDIGLTYLTLRKYEVAKIAFSTSAELFREIGDTSWHLNAIDGLAMTLIAQNNHEQARDLLTDALQLLATNQGLVNYEYLYRSLHQHWLQTIGV